MPTPEITSISHDNFLEIYSDNVASREVAIAYLQAELPNILGANIRSDSGSSVESLQLLSDEQLFRALEAVSYSYRMNGVFATITNQANEWIDTEVPIDAIALTGTKPHINDIVYSPEIANNPQKFADYLIDYFADNEDTDPLDLGEFRVRGSLQDVRRTRLITLQTDDGSLEIVDGTHRLMESAMLGALSVRAYVAIPNGKENLSMKGDSTFLTLRIAYERATSDDDREIILRACEQLARDSVDGFSAIQAYWIDHPRDPSVQDAGHRLLAHLSKTI